MYNLKFERNKRNWSLEELGTLINVQKSVISKYERGSSYPSISVLLKLSNIFKCSTDYLLDLTKNPYTQEAETFLDKASELPAFDIYRDDLKDLSSDEISAIIAFIKTMKSLRSPGSN